MTKENIVAQSGIVKLCKENPHYYSYKGKPTLLITSAEHYGAVINSDFDYIAYLDRLQQYELNYTRIYPGIYFEVEGQFIRENTLAPESSSLLLPWARSEEPGALDGGNKFDLAKWEESYFKRLRDFISAAAARDIVVEICLFNCQYPESWKVNPFNFGNNIQGIGDHDFNDFQTTRYREWFDLQRAYVNKIVREVNCFDNIILEICDEPTLKGTEAVPAVVWISRLVDEIKETEKELPKKHLIAQQYEIGVDFTDDERVPVIVTQYIWQNEFRQVGGVEGLDSEYGHNKPIELNETAFYPIWYDGDIKAASRVEAWEFVIGGGAGFNQLNGLFTVNNPSGETKENHEILKSLQDLKNFLNSFEFTKMRQEKGFIKNGIPYGVHVRCISEPGRQYAMYIHHSRMKANGNCYIVTPGDYSLDLELNLPAGNYKAEWILPETTERISENTFRHNGGIIVMKTPEYTVDIALRIKELLNRI